MEITRHFDIEKDFKKLKRYPAPKESLESWERLFSLKGISETPGIKQYPGFGNLKIFKARVIPLKEKCGKSDGYRLVFMAAGDNEYKMLVFSRHTMYNNEKELIKTIKDRIS